MAEAIIEKKLPARRDVPVGDTWDLSSLFSSDAEWEAALAEWEKMIPGFEAFTGTLAKSPERLAACLSDCLAGDGSRHDPRQQAIAGARYGLVECTRAYERVYRSLLPPAGSVRR